MIGYRPPSMSEHLTQLACKVDFGATDGEDLTTDDKNEDEQEEEKPFQQPHWPFEGVRNKVRLVIFNLKIFILTTSFGRKKLIVLF